MSRSSVNTHLPLWHISQHGLRASAQGPVQWEATVRREAAEGWPRWFLSTWAKSTVRADFPRTPNPGGWQSHLKGQC